MITEKESKENKAIGRTEIVFTVKHEGKSQPSRVELEGLLKAKIKEKHFIIKKIQSRFGMAESQAIVHAYKDEKTMNYYEPKYLFKRGKPAEVANVERAESKEQRKEEKK